MSLSTFAEQFDNSYQLIFQKTLVAKEIANTRFESVLRYGESVERVSYDIDSVLVRSVTRGSASTIDTVSDSSQLLEVNLEFEATFHLSDGEMTQAGPLNPGMVIGGKIAHKVSQHLDGKVFAEVLNSANDFDNGDLTGALTSDGAGITLSSTTVPQMVSRMPAKLMNKENVDANTNGVMVVDAVAASDITQYLLGKNIDLAGSTFKNGYTGPVHNASMYVSENLTGEVVIGTATNPTADDTFTINAVTWTFKAAPSAAGEIDIGADADATRVLIAAAINNTNGYAASAGSATAYYELTAANRAILENADISATDDATANTTTVQGRGRLTVSETFTATADVVDSNVLHCYYGKRGAIDLVIQDLSPVDIRPEADRRGANIFSSYLAGVKTFTDGSKQFLDVLINNA